MIGKWSRSQQLLFLFLTLHSTVLL